METCICGRKMISPIGTNESQILIVGDHPDYEDLQKNMPFVSRKGDVLRGELGKAGIDIRKCRLTYIWRHEPVEKTCKGHMGDVLREMKTRPYVLLMGAETLKAFGIAGVDLRVGLQIESVFFPEAVKVAIATMNPPQNSGVGEFRLALSKFARRINE